MAGFIPVVVTASMYRGVSQISPGYSVQSALRTSQSPVPLGSSRSYHLVQQTAGSKERVTAGRVKASTWMNAWYWGGVSGQCRRRWNQLWRTHSYVTSQTTERRTAAETNTVVIAHFVGLVLVFADKSNSWIRSGTESSGTGTEVSTKHIHDQLTIGLQIYEWVRLNVLMHVVDSNNSETNKNLWWNPWMFQKNWLSTRVPGVQDP